MPKIFIEICFVFDCNRVVILLKIRFLTFLDLNGIWQCSKEPPRNLKHFYDMVF